MFHEIVKAICARTDDAGGASETVRAAREVVRETLGKIAYDSYCESTGGVSLVTGAVLPSWEMLPDDTQKAWRHSAIGVSGALLAAVEGLLGE